MLPHTYFDDDMISCPDCGSPEKYEVDSVTWAGTDNKTRITYTYKCIDCGKVYNIRETKEE